MQSNRLELSDYLPADWQMRPTRQGLKLIAPNHEDAGLFFQGARQYLKATADYLKSAIEVVWEGCSEPLKIEAPQQPQPQINSYAPSIITPDANYQAVMDFIAGKQAEGLIVTVMAMKSDKFLFVNGAQVTDRGGNAETWIGVDAKQLVWGRSLTGTLPGKDRGINYYARLYELLESDRHIPDWGYYVTRPNGDLYRDVSTYFYLENYLGVAARIAISRVGDSELVERAVR